MKSVVFILVDILIKVWGWEERGYVSVFLLVAKFDRKMYIDFKHCQRWKNI